jgi:ATP-dependent Clp protease ATP-binding subunit ClpA
MEAKFSNSIKEAISLAREIAFRDDSPEIDCLHSVLAMMYIYDSNGSHSLNLVFLKLQVDKSALESAIKSHLNQKFSFERKKRKAKENSIQNIPLSKEFEKVLKVSYLLAKNADRTTSLVTIFHILAAITREASDETKELLSSHRITKKQMDLFLKKYLNEPSDIVDQTAPFDLDAMINGISLYSGAPISLYFDTFEYSNDDIVEIISIISDVYSSISGDHLEIKGISTYEPIDELASL